MLHTTGTIIRIVDQCVVYLCADEVQNKIATKRNLILIRVSKYFRYHTVLLQHKVLLVI